MVACCALGTDVRHWMFRKKVNLVQGQQEGPLKVTRDVCNINFLPVLDETLGTAGSSLVPQ